MVTPFDSLPTGYRFRPTDQELIIDYLKKMIAGTLPREARVIPVIDLCKFEPWDLPAKSIIPDKSEWFFFGLKDVKYRNSSGRRQNRSTEKGYWKVTGEDRKIWSNRKRQCQIGTKKSLVFQHRQAPKRCQSEWVIHEYSIDDPEIAGRAQGDYVLYRLIKKMDEGSPSSSKEVAKHNTCPPAAPHSSSLATNNSVVHVAAQANQEYLEPNHPGNSVSLHHSQQLTHTIYAQRESSLPNGFANQDVQVPGDSAQSVGFPLFQTDQHETISTTPSSSLEIFHQAEFLNPPFDASTNFNFGESSATARNSWMVASTMNTYGEDNSPPFAPPQSSLLATHSLNALVVMNTQANEEYFGPTHPDNPISLPGSSHDPLSAQSICPHIGSCDHNGFDNQVGAFSAGYPSDSTEPHSQVEYGGDHNMQADDLHFLLDNFIVDNYEPLPEILNSMMAENVLDKHVNASHAGYVSNSSEGPNFDEISYNRINQNNPVVDSRNQQPQLIVGANQPLLPQGDSVHAAEAPDGDFITLGDVTNASGWSAQMEHVSSDNAHCEPTAFTIRTSSFNVVQPIHGVALRRMRLQQDIRVIPNNRTVAHAMSSDLNLGIRVEISEVSEQADQNSEHGDAHENSSIDNYSGRQIKPVSRSTRRNTTTQVRKNGNSMPAVLKSTCSRFQIAELVKAVRIFLFALLLLPLICIPILILRN